ncbi:excisionase family DNA binding protein [Caldalkalibacillus uzonensis]|uniref:Excisionase family DNA binding protein n=1 Tax=Caldalkalibacillus uzonensis TaxID=353224 RepID=A0ABU0CV40_9BACI|nr:helix-turn-helix domain-containing protein [Caldalkalibacillus uzonensis]MDQ0340283.1 excisionase family DNA binding protein [Caldalkalibacillus uzonensis]
MYKFETRDELIQFIREQVMTSAEAVEYLGVTRQTLNSLVQRGKLHPVKELKRDRLFLRSDLEARKKESSELRKKYRPYDS